MAKLPHQRATYKQLVKELGSRGVTREALDMAIERLHQLQAWCREAEASGIHALQAYAARLKGYSLQATRA